MRSYEELVSEDELRRFVAFQLAVQIGWTGGNVQKAAPAIEKYLKTGELESND